MQNIKQLDSIRAIAVMLVILFHWTPANHFSHILQFGSLGVEMFFVLSGFLITQILLQNRSFSEDHGLSMKSVLFNFFGRRVLRIFPIYYLFIFLLLLFRKHLSEPLAYKDILFAITYTSNFYVFSIKSWPLYTVHLWSLAVEEQFYLFWPFLMLFIRRGYLLPCIIIFILIGVLSRSFIGDIEFGSRLPFTCFDSLGMGALLAWIYTYSREHLIGYFKVMSILALISVVGMTIVAVNGFDELWQMRLLHAFIGSWVVCSILLYHSRKNFVMSLLSSKALVSFGKVSYGLYLYHVVFEFLMTHAWNRFLLYRFSSIKPWQGWVIFWINVFLLYCLCLLSWKFIERPILALKKYFPYQKGPLNERRPVAYT